MEICTQRDGNLFIVPASFARVIYLGNLFIVPASFARVIYLIYGLTIQIFFKLYFYNAKLMSGFIPVFRFIQV